jgi:hypothetical protein
MIPVPLSILKLLIELAAGGVRNFKSAALALTSHTAISPRRRLSW